MSSRALQKAMAVSDHTIVTIIIAFQFLGSLACIGSLLLFSRYPGADFNVLGGILFFGAGSGTAILLHHNQRKEFWRRLPAALWNVMFAAYAIFGRGLNWKRLPAGVPGYALLSVCMAIYLGATAAIGFSAARTMSQTEEGRNSTVD